MTFLAAHTLASFWMPERGSAAASEVDALFHFVLWISVFFLLLITGLLVLFVVRYRKRPGHEAKPTATHNTALEITWSVIPLILVIVIFAMGFRAFLESHTPSANAYEIAVTGQRWSWEFRYPNGYATSELHLPVDRPVKLTVTSMDVIHSLWVPAFRIKRDAVPGRFNVVWVQPTRPGMYDAYCAEYCGTSHSTMTAKVIVHPSGEFETWLADASRNPLEDLTPEQLAFWTTTPDVDTLIQKYPELAKNPGIRKLVPLWKQGRKSYIMYCASCHEQNLGPKLDELWGKGQEQALVDGREQTVDVDENYLRESLVAPQAKVTKGWERYNMTSFKGKFSDRQITAIIEYLKKKKEADAAK